MTTKQRLAAVRRARRHLRAATGYDPNGPHYAAVDKALDALEADFKPPKRRTWEDIGPVQPGGVSLLDMSLTHQSSGLPKNAKGITLWPAVDTAWGGGGGVVLIAHENCVVDTKDSSASPGEAIYVTGDSKLRVWFAHIDRDWPLGHRFEKGDVIGKTLPIPGKSDHGHIGVNAEALLGKGKQLKYGRDGNGPDYTLGAPTIREQLRKALA